MRRAASLGLATWLALAAFDAAACRTNPPRVSPPIAELMTAADLVIDVRVEHIRPFTVEQNALMDRLMSDPPLNVPIRFPTTPAEFSTLRLLKGRLPDSALLQNGATSCDVAFREGRRYIVFGRAVGPSGEIEPLFGTFSPEEGQHGAAALAELETILRSSNQTPP